ncbi:MAG: Fic family protein [Cellulosilyticaceae bacterium]
MYTTNLFLKTYYTKEECLVRGLDYEKEVIERRSRCNKVLNKYWFNITARLHDTLNELIIEMEDVLNLSRDNQLILEAVYSSAIEGYYSTVAEVKEALQDGKVTREDTSKVVRNYRALRYIADKGKLSKEDILKVDSILLNKGIKDYRKEVVNVVDDSTGEITHYGHSVEVLEKEMSSYIEYYNQNNKFSKYQDKLIKSCILHYIFVDIHPLKDGNGRTARSLQFQYLINNVDNNFKNLSISYMPKEMRIKYYTALESVESEEWDLTYFIQTQLDIILYGVKRIKLLNRIGEVQRIITNMETESSEVFNNSRIIIKILKKLITTNMDSMLIKRVQKLGEWEYIKEDIELLDEYLEYDEKRVYLRFKKYD